MKLWLISQTENIGYDTYSEAIVVAETEEEAKRIHPGRNSLSNWWDSPDHYLDDWASHPDNVLATEIGIANPNLAMSSEPGHVVLASFHAS